MIFEDLRHYLRIPPSSNSFQSRLSQHEALKAQLYILGYRLHFTPILEAQCDKEHDTTRIDCIFLRSGKPICGIEVDYSIKMKSIHKLLHLGSAVEKIIISYGKETACSKAIYRHKNQLNDIKTFQLRRELER